MSSRIGVRWRSAGRVAALVLVFLATTLVGCVNRPHVLYDASIKNGKGGQQWVWPYFLEGKPTVLAFWNTDVAQCLREMPAMKTLSRRDGSIEFVTVVTGYDRLDIEKWMRREQLDYVVLLDLEEKFARQLGVRTYPTFIYFDANGEEIARRSDIRTVANWFDQPRWLQLSGAEPMSIGEGAPAQAVFSGDGY